MKVKRLNWNGKKSSDADAIITDGEYECLAFCYPCNIFEGQELIQPLGCFMTRDIMVSHESKTFLRKDKDNYFGYSGVGQLIDKKGSLIKLGGFRMELDGCIPTDLENGEFVEFKCSRIDVRE